MVRGVGAYFVTPWSTFFFVREPWCTYAEKLFWESWLKCTPWNLNCQNPRFNVTFLRSVKNVSICLVTSEMQNCCSSTRDEIQEDGDVYNRLRLGWNLRFSRRNRKTFSFRDGNVVTCPLHFAKQNSKAWRWIHLRTFGNCSYLAMWTTSFLKQSLSFFMTLISPKIPTLSTSNMTRSISITSIEPNIKQSSALKEPTFLHHCQPFSWVSTRRVHRSTP